MDDCDLLIGGDLVLTLDAADTVIRNGAVAVKDRLIVDLGPATGTVEGVSLRTTRIRDVQGVLWHIPNGQINRVGNKIPGISPNELTARLGYDETMGPLKGLGGFVEVILKDSFYMENANFLKAPGYELVNLNVHYKTDLTSESLKSLSLFL